MLRGSRVGLVCRTWHFTHRWLPCLPLLPAGACWGLLGSAGCPSPTEPAASRSSTAAHMPCRCMRQQCVRDLSLPAAGQGWHRCALVCRRSPDAVSWMPMGLP